jgi:hypothetical protein
LADVRRSGSLNNQTCDDSGIRRDNYIKESGFATPPGSTSPNPAVAEACADALSRIIALQTPAAK